MWTQIHWNNIQGVSGGIINISGGGSMDFRNAWKVLKCGAGEGWRRSVGPIT